MVYDERKILLGERHPDTLESLSNISVSVLHLNFIIAFKIREWMENLGIISNCIQRK